MSAIIQGVIQKDIKEDNEVVYFLRPSHKLGIVGKCGNAIDNLKNDPIWDDIKANSFDYPQAPTHRVEVTLNEPSVGTFDLITIKSLRRIEG